MLANGSVSMLAAAASADALAPGGDMLDRRNLAASSTPVSANANNDADTSSLRIAETQQGQGRMSPSISSSMSSSATTSIQPRAAKRFPTGLHVGSDEFRKFTPPSDHGAVPPGDARTLEKSETFTNSIPRPRQGQQKQERGEKPRSPSQMSATIPGGTEPRRSSAVEVGNDRCPSLSETPRSVDRIFSAATSRSAETAAQGEQDAAPSSLVSGATPTPEIVNVHDDADARALREVKSVRRGAFTDKEYKVAVATGHGDEVAKQKQQPGHMQHHQHHRQPVVMSGSLCSVQSSLTPISAQPTVQSLLSATTSVVDKLETAPKSEIDNSRKRRGVDVGELDRGSRNVEQHSNGHSLEGGLFNGSVAATSFELLSKEAARIGDRSAETRLLASDLDDRYRWSTTDRLTERWPVENTQGYEEAPSEAPRPRDTRLHRDILEDPALGEGWDENGNDLSKIANEAVRRMHCRAWLTALEREATAIRAGDHPELVRRSVLSLNSSKRRRDVIDTNAKRQKSTAERLYCMEMKGIQAKFETALEQTKERLMNDLNEEIRKSKSRLEGFKEVENRMNTRHTRGNTKCTVEDPWVVSAGTKTTGNSKRPLCQVSLVLEDEEVANDITDLRHGRYMGHAPSSGGYGNGGGDSSRGGSRSGGDGAGMGAFQRGHGDHASSGASSSSSSSSGTSGRTRRPPAWRRDE